MRTIILRRPTGHDLCSDYAVSSRFAGGSVPRVALVLMWLFSTILDRAYHSLLIPLLGFIFCR